MNTPPPLEDHKIRCFIVEDSAMILHDLTDTLEQLLPLTVIGSAADESSAANWLSSSQIACDLMIVDVFLRQGSGLKVLALAASRAPLVRKVILTNYATDDIRRKSLALGADRVFDKSSELEDLFAYCANLAELKQAALSSGQAH